MLGYGSCSQWSGPSSCYEYFWIQILYMYSRWNQRTYNLENVLPFINSFIIITIDFNLNGIFCSFFTGNWWSYFQIWNLHFFLISASERRCRINLGTFHSYNLSPWISTTHWHSFSIFAHISLSLILSCFFLFGLLNRAEKHTVMRPPLLRCYLGNHIWWSVVTNVLYLLLSARCFC
jgi:hypothetical protein